MYTFLTANSFSGLSKSGYIDVICFMPFEVGVPVFDRFRKGRPTAKNTRAWIGTQQTAYQVAFSEQDWFIFFCGWRQIVGVVIDPNNRVFIHFHLHMIIRFHIGHYQSAGTNSLPMKCVLKNHARVYNYQSVLRLFTGLAVAALMAW